jgi:hypothetical protein
MKKMNKKGQMGLDQLPRIALVFLVVVVLFTLSLVILTKFQDTDTVQGNAKANAAITAGIDAVAEIPTNWLGIIAIVIAASLVITIVVVALARSIGGMGGGNR